jgi:hypothetical protein
MVRDVICPEVDAEPGQYGPTIGCGHRFTAEPDFEGFVDCPNCGLWFDPDHPNSQPQP